MPFKFDTKEKFTVITPDETDLAAIMADEHLLELASRMKLEPPHVVFCLKNVNVCNESSAEKLAELQASFYENNCSFVICELQKPVLEKLEEMELLDVMNITPSESEAWDMVQMEEIERELLG